MVSKNSFTFIIFLLCLLFFKTAWALSCAPPNLSDSVISNSELIFEGRIIEIKPGRDGTQKGASELEYWEKAVFKVSKAWKGVKKDDQVTVYRNVYWGGHDKIESIHLVLTHKKNVESLGKVYVAPYCQNTFHFPNTKENMELISRFFKNH